MGIGNFTFIFMFNKLLRLIEQAAGLQVSIFASLQKKIAKNCTCVTRLAPGIELTRHHWLLALRGRLKPCILFMDGVFEFNFYCN